ncbi:TIGR02117 family protein [Paracrocinitomix mangrovi]|uniref:TIGR02117 family protein n=1 Tax=Paracrocinitomix mangrovi TaxID=2862509 RepID=UPI001C8CFBF0|nr:TIGR02117 family protein [Paracrocinitomix mangrovi]UKN00153.1 TIGR02117 family protein [Paracrocinitomix mangrovi]
MKNKTLKIAVIIISQTITTIIGGFTLVIMYAMLGLIFSYHIPYSGAANHQIFIRSNGIHTDICVPVSNDLQDWNEFLNADDFKSRSNATYYSFGWGDRDFYTVIKTWDDFSFPIAFKALMVPTETAMHVEALNYTPSASDHCLSFEITDEGYKKLCEYIESSFYIKDSKPLLIPEITYYGYDRFYEANNSYHVFETCNSWTNAGLKNAGVKTAAWNIFAISLMKFHK